MNLHETLPYNTMTHMIPMTQINVHNFSSMYVIVLYQYRASIVPVLCQYRASIPKIAMQHKYMVSF